MRKEVLAIGGSIVVVVAVLGALAWQQQGAQPPPPTATPPASATPASATAMPVTATPVPAPATPTTAPLPALTLPVLTPNATGPIDLGDGMAITLASGWVGALHPAPAALGLADPTGAPLLAAWQGADAYLAAPQRMTLIRTARAGMPLPAYLSDLAVMLATTPGIAVTAQQITCLLYTSPSPRDRTRSRMPSSA